MSKKLTKSMAREIRQMEIRDYQNRGGNYPKSDIPVSININTWTHNGIEHLSLSASFKNTSEESGKRWIERKLSSYKDYIQKITSSQTGDYQDDWIDVEVLMSIRKSTKAS